NARRRCVIRLQALTCRFERVQARHSNVKNDNVGFPLLCLLPRVTAVPRLAAYPPLRLGVQKRHQTLAYHFMVVGHEDSQCAHGLPPHVPGAWDSTAATLAWSIQ